VVTLEGLLDDSSPGNFVYWFKLHLEQKFHLMLTEHSTWNLTEERKVQKVWSISRDSMRETFKRRSVLAGYPPSK
jgi:hypothetical protein